MTEPEPEPNTRVVWHYLDGLRLDGDWTLCGIPKTPDPAGVAWPCEPCMAEHRRRREAGS